MLIPHTALGVYIPVQSNLLLAHAFWLANLNTCASNKFRFDYTGVQTPRAVCGINLGWREVSLHPRDINFRLSP